MDLALGRRSKIAEQDDLSHPCLGCHSHASAKRLLQVTMGIPNEHRHGRNRGYGLFLSATDKMMQLSELKCLTLKETVR
jgi:hypothetical protein